MTTRHVLVLDVNVYLEVASLVGEPFTWANFNTIAARVAREACPHQNAAVDCLRTIAMCQSGKFAGEDVVEVWTNAHIDRLVEYKAKQSTVRDQDGHRGLGWSAANAEDLVDDLVYGTTANSNGGTLGSVHMPDSNPPLDHEDGMVFGAGRYIAGDDPLSVVTVVTMDRGFVDEYRAGKLSPHVRVVFPGPMAAAMRAARQRLSIRAMRPPPPTT